jgi:cytochrome b involved in lipid metabolism
MAEYVPYHPGGLETIMLSCGRDCTALFESYHPFTHQLRHILENYLVNDDDDDDEADETASACCSLP